MIFCRASWRKRTSFGILMPFYIRFPFWCARLLARILPHFCQYFTNLSSFKWIFHSCVLLRSHQSKSQPFYKCSSKLLYVWIYIGILLLKITEALIGAKLMITKKGTSGQLVLFLMTLYVSVQ